MAKIRQANEIKKYENSSWKKVRLVLALIFLAFLLLDFFFPSYPMLSSALKFSSIIILFFAQYFLGRKEAGLWKGAAGLTILTDCLLLFTLSYEWGVFFFILVHFLRFSYRKRTKGGYFLLYLGLFGIGLFFILHLFLPRLISLALIYSLFLLLNTIEALSSGDKKLSLAYLLFCACDFSVVMATLPQFSSLAGPFSKLIWLFYLPSQLLLADQIIDSQASSVKGSNEDKAPSGSGQE